jgi:hypothetical protein
MTTAAKTKTQIRKERKAKIPKLGKTRNNFVLYTIQMLKNDHKSSKGTFFQDENTKMGFKTDGHPYSGTENHYFVVREPGQTESWRVACMDKLHAINLVGKSFLTKDGAHKKAMELAK